MLELKHKSMEYANLSDVVSFPFLFLSKYNPDVPGAVSRVTLECNNNSQAAPEFTLTDEDNMVRSSIISYHFNPWKFKEGDSMTHR